MPAYGSGRQPADILSEQPDGSFGAVVKAGDEACQCRLPGAGSSDNTDGLPWHSGERKTLQSLGFCPGVSKTDIFKCHGRDIAARRIRDFQWRSFG